MLAIYMVDPIIHACGRTPAFAAMQKDLLVLARNAWLRMISRKEAIVAARVPITVQPYSSSHGCGSASSASFAIQLSGGDTEDVSLCRTVANADGREDDIGQLHCCCWQFRPEGQTTRDWRTRRDACMLRRERRWYKTQP
jgi:hypothetical protein